MAAGDAALGYRGVISVKRAADASPIAATFVGAWSFESKRDFKERDPYITATSTGASTKVPGARTGSGSIDGDINQGTDAFRTAMLAAERSGEVVELVLEQEDGLTATFDAYIAGFKMETKSTDGSTVSFDFEANGDYNFTATP